MDIVLNEIGVRLHRCVATVHLHDAIKVDFHDGSGAVVLPDSAWDPARRVDVGAIEDPARYLDLLQFEIRGASLYATAPHTSSECMFRDQLVVPFGTVTASFLAV